MCVRQKIEFFDCRTGTNDKKRNERKKKKMRRWNLNIFKKNCSRLYEIARTVFQNDLIIMKIIWLIIKFFFAFMYALF